MGMNEEQKKHVEMQMSKHRHRSYVTEFRLDEKNIIAGFVIEKGVFRSDEMSSGIYLARFLFHNKDLYRDKEVLDIGCGPGIQGIVMLRYGASKATFADISTAAVANTRENLLKQGLEAGVIKSDLFKSFPPEEKYDVIVFNHPFFPGDPDEDVPVSGSMLGGTGLVRLFFSEVRKFLRDNDSIIIMPYFCFAGPENDPVTHAESNGLRVIRCDKFVSKKGLQPGDFRIYVIGQRP